MIIFFGMSVYSWAETTALPSKADITVTTTITQDPAPVQAPVAAVEPDECKDLLPLAEQDYAALTEKYQQIKSGQLDSYESYTGSFSDMTEVLFQLTDEKEQETKRITDSRDQLKTSVEKFNLDRSSENTKILQDQYMDLTVRLYSSVMDGQKILETLKSQLSKVEASRSQFEGSKQDLEKIDHQRLALEAKLITLKIRCQSDR